MMKSDLLRKATLALGVGLAALAPYSFVPTPLHAQSVISGDIVGTVQDPSGAAVPNAQVTVTSTSTGAVKTSTADASGNFRVSLLNPGSYTVSATASGFQTSTTTISVSAGQVAHADLKLAVGSSAQTVQVTEAAPLLHTEDAQVSSTFDLQQVQALPNPGNDLTFFAQTTPGVVMNNQGGYGNLSVFGLPGTSNTFTVNGGYQNDPFLNLNNSGATNLLLGNNDIASVSVISNAYDAAFGGLGGAQINEISRSGANQFHGNASYWWNGRVMNANDWFNNATGTPRPFDNVNQYAAAIGGPIKKDKLFWFFNTEGLRVILPVRDTVYAPSAALQSSILSTIPSTSVPLYTTLFNQYNNAKGFASAVPDPANPGFVSFNAVASNFTHEWLISGRVDDNLGQNDHAFIHFKVDKGLQATYTSLLNPLFNADSPQPEYNGEFQETHTFSPNVTNQFLFAAEYYRALFTNTSLAQSLAQIPFTLIFTDSDLSNNPGGAYLGGENYAWPEGRNVTNYQFADDFNWTKGNHAIKIGWSIRRDDVSDFDPGILTTPEVFTSFSSFSAGTADIWAQNFPLKISQPLALYNMGGYIQDQWKVQPNFTLTYGLRLEHNSNPTCITSCFGYSNGAFAGLNTSTAAPLNSLIRSGQHTAFMSLQKVGYEPRVGFAYLPGGVNSRTTIRGGFGMFVDVFPATVADGLLNNVPLSIPVTLLSGTIVPGNPNYTLGPGPTSGATAASAGAAATRSGYNAGLSTAAIGFTPNLLTTSPHINYPTYEEYSLTVEQQLGRNDVISVGYVGNHGYHEPVVDPSFNAYGFGSLPATQPNPNFGQVTQDYSGASSNYNGLITSVRHTSRGLSVQVNYAWSHALDEISNGGFLPFGSNSVSPDNPYNLSQNYGNADYDTRNYVSANAVYNIPYFHGGKALFADWEIAADVFHSTGYPFTVIDGPTAAGIPFYSGALFAQQTSGGFSTHCGGGSHNYLTGTPCAFGAAGATAGTYAHFTSATDFGQQHRNQFYGPNYTDTDLDLLKTFHIPHWESASIQGGAQFFNLFNHPNFGQPYFNLSNGTQLGEIHNMVSTPTSILGSFLGGDASPRLIQLKAVLTF